jgi:hypothetical protein
MLRTAAAHWTRKTKQRTYQGPTRWWQHPIIVHHVNKSICGAAVDGRPLETSRCSSVACKDA